jgi:hypothetical protein
MNFPHKRLLHKLRAYGIKGHLLEWINDWLTTRQQRVVYEGHTAEWKNVLSGVPQGSVLGPLLFVIFINDLVDQVNNFIRLYADDTKILAKVKSREDVERLQSDINKCVIWSQTWLMSFNIDKCKIMHIGRGKNKSTHEYTMKDHNGETRILETTKAERDLGVLVSDDLKFSNQAKSAAAKAMWKFGVLKKVFSSHSPRLLTTLWKAHIRPHLEHAIQAWSPYLKEDIDVLERVQRRVTKYMDGMKGLNYGERLEKLGWTTLEKRRQRGDLIFTYQVMHNNTIVDIDWRRAQPLSAGPASGIRANHIRSNPLIYPHCSQRNHFITTRVDALLRSIPEEMLRIPSVNGFKNAYDNFQT